MKHLEHLVCRILLLIIFLNANAVQSVPLPRISIQMSGGQASFVSQHENGSFISFIPRGANYIRLNGSQGVSGRHPVYHSTFSNVYYKGNRSLAIKRLDELQHFKYNVVRVFIDTGTYHRFDGINGNESTLPFNTEYLDNVADFINLAADRNVYVMPTLDDIPRNSYFAKLCGGQKELGYPNIFYMSEPCIQAKKSYVIQFLKEIKSRLGPNMMTSICWISLQNEAYYSTSSLPFSSVSIQVNTADGNSYDMASSTSRQEAADSNMLNFVNTVVKGAKNVNPEMMFTIGLFTNNAVGKEGITGLLPVNSSDKRFPFRPLKLFSSNSSLDLVDVHIYQRPSWTFEKDLSSIEWDKCTFVMKPALMGEFGAWKVNPTMFNTSEAAMKAMVHQQVDSCKRNFSGWLFWTLDTFEQPRLWNLQSSADLRTQLSPLVRPNACNFKVH